VEESLQSKPKNSFKSWSWWDLQG